MAANESVEPRETSIFVAYANKASFDLAINQAGAVIRRTANALSSMYYGTEYSMVESDKTFFGSLRFHEVCLNFRFFFARTTKVMFEIGVSVQLRKMGYNYVKVNANVVS